MEHTAVVDSLRLSLIIGISPRTLAGLLARFGTARQVLDAPFAEVAACAGLETAQALALGPDARLVERSLRWGERPGHHMVPLGDDAYPAALREITDPPLLLYARGRIDLMRASCFAIVGARSASSQGREDARAFARALSDAGLCIVSGLAHGVDAAAHHGGLEGRSSSIAVMGTGPDVIYPGDNRDLALRLADSGCLLTEFCLGMPPLAENFPRRNRLISGLSRGVLVIEANARSGSLITARFAAEQNREVFALPGSIHSTLSKGCHKLIKDGAKLTEGVADILGELGLEIAASPKVARAPRSHPLLVAMGFDPVSLDQMTERTGMTAAAIAAQLSLFEIDGTISALPGGRFQRADGVA